MHSPCTSKVIEASFGSHSVITAAEMSTPVESPRRSRVLTIRVAIGPAYQTDGNAEAALVVDAGNRVELGALG